MVTSANNTAKIVVSCIIAISIVEIEQDQKIATILMVDFVGNVEENCWTLLYFLARITTTIQERYFKDSNQIWYWQSEQA